MCSAKNRDNIIRGDISISMAVLTPIRNSHDAQCPADWLAERRGWERPRGSMAPKGVYRDFPPRDHAPSEYAADLVASFFGSGLMETTAPTDVHCW